MLTVSAIPFLKQRKLVTMAGSYSAMWLSLLSLTTNADHVAKPVAYRLAVDDERRHWPTLNDLMARRRICNG